MTLLRGIFWTRFYKQNLVAPRVWKTTCKSEPVLKDSQNLNAHDSRDQNGIKMAPQMQENQAQQKERQTYTSLLSCFEKYTLVGGFLDGQNICI